MNTAQLLKEFWRFVVHPTPLTPLTETKGVIRKVVFVVSITLVAFIPTFLEDLIRIGFHYPDASAISSEISTTAQMAGIDFSLAIPLTILGGLLGILFLALLEEIAFRLPLRIHKWPLIIGLTFALSYILPSANALLGIEDTVASVLVLAVLVVFPLILLIGYRRMGPLLEAFLTRNFHYYTWVLMGAFAFIHMANPVGGVTGIRLDTILYALFVLPSALVFTYLRLRFGFWWAVASHTLTNVVAVTMIIFLID